MPYTLMINLALNERTGELLNKRYICVRLQVDGWAGL